MTEVLLTSTEDVENFIKWASSELHNIDIVSFDLETDNKEEHLAKVVGIGLAFDDETGYYLPVKDKHGNAFFHTTILASVYGFVNHLLQTKKIIGHNIIYDSLVWEHNGHSSFVDNIHADTILMKHLLDEERPFGLKETAVKYLGPWADKAQQDLYDNIVANGGSVTKDNLQMFKADTEVLGTYCCWDVLLVYKLYNLFSPRIDAEGLRGLFEEETMPLYRLVTIPMKRHGIPVDVAYFQKLLEEINVDMRSLQHSITSWMEEHLGFEFEEYTYKLLNEVAAVKKKGGFPKALAMELGEVLPDSLGKKVLADHRDKRTVRWILGEEEIDPATLLNAQLRLFFEKKDQAHVFNLNSKDQLKHLFFNILREEPLSETDGGQPQVDEEFLESIKTQYEFVPMLLDLNKLQKIRGTYIEGILDRQYQGIIYTSMLQFGTTSGRYSSTNPNLQNLPRPKEEDAGLSEIVLKYTNAIRAGFVSPPGYEFIDTDYQALEPRCFAHMSGSKDLQAIFHSGVDMYSAIAIQMFKIKGVSANKKDANFLGKIHPEKRQQVKAFCLAVVYGAEAYRIAGLLNIPKEEAQKLIDMYLDAFPDLRQYIEDCHYDVNTKGYVSTVFGRVRHLQRGKELFRAHGYDLLNSRWAKKHHLHEERREYKNLLNNSTNFRIQGLAGHIINRAMITIAREFRKNNIDGYVTLMIHDQTVCSVRETHVEKARAIVRDAMQNVVKLDVPLIAEPSVATNLKDGH